MHLADPVALVALVDLAALVDLEAHFHLQDLVVLAVLADQVLRPVQDFRYSLDILVDPVDPVVLVLLFRPVVRCVLAIP